MFCKYCGASNEETDNFCKACGAGINVINTETMEGDEVLVGNTDNVAKENATKGTMPTFESGHSIFLIIFSVCCCGNIVSIIFAVLSLIEGNKVNEYAEAGDYERAMKYKKESDKWAKFTYISWVVVAAIIILYFVFVFGMAFLGAMSEM